MDESENRQKRMVEELVLIYYNFSINFNLYFFLGPNTVNPRDIIYSIYQDWGNLGHPEFRKRLTSIIALILSVIVWLLQIEYV